MPQKRVMKARTMTMAKPIRNCHSELFTGAALLGDAISCAPELRRGTFRFQGLNRDGPRQISRHGARATRSLVFRGSALVLVSLPRHVWPLDQSRFIPLKERLGRGIIYSLTVCKVRERVGTAGLPSVTGVWSRYAGSLTALTGSALLGSELQVVPGTSDTYKRIQPRFLAEACSLFKPLCSATCPIGVWARRRILRCVGPTKQ